MVLTEFSNLSLKWVQMNKAYETLFDSCKSYWSKTGNLEKNSWVGLSQTIICTSIKSENSFLQKADRLGSWLPRYPVACESSSGKCALLLNEIQKSQLPWKHRFLSSFSLAKNGSIDHQVNYCSFSGKSYEKENIKLFFPQFAS